MSKFELVTEISKIEPKERRELARLIFEMEEDAEVLEESDARANKRLLMLDALEAEDAGRAST